MFKQTLKRMVLTGATVTVLLSMAAPAVMAAPISKGYGPLDPCWPIHVPGCDPIKLQAVVLARRMKKSREESRLFFCSWTAAEFPRRPLLGDS